MDARRDDIRERAAAAARQADMAGVLARYGVETRHSNSRTDVVCPYCGAHWGKCYVWRGNDGADRITCFACGRTADVLDVVGHITGMGYNDVIADIGVATGAITSDDADIIIGRHTAARTPRPVAPIAKVEPPAPVVDRADADVLDCYYRSLVKATGCDAHRAHLMQARGIKARRLAEYCDWPPAPVDVVLAHVKKTATADLAARVVEQLTRIPGVVADGNAYRYSTRCPGVGLLTVDDTEHAIGVQIRLDHPPTETDSTGAVKDKYKYVWLSSGSQGGASSGAPAGWLPAAKSDRAATRREKLGYRRPRYRAVDCVVTEGKYKAETLSSWGYNAIYVSGVALWGSAGVIDMVRRTCGDGAMIGICYDADADRKPQVLAQRTQLADALLAAGYRPVIWSWPLDDGKGIDDLLRDGKTDAAHKVVLTPHREPEWCRAAEQVDRPTGAEIPRGRIATVVVGDCSWRNGYTGRTIADCLLPGATWGTSVIFARVPMWQDGAVMRVRLSDKQDKDGRCNTYAAWAPATREQIYDAFGAPPDEPDRGPKTSRKTPARRRWEAAVKAEAATARLRLACEIDKLCTDGDSQKHLPCDKVSLAVAKWGDQAVQTLRLSPYRCGREMGISLAACDRIAGVQKGDTAWLGDERLRWCAEWALDICTDSGHTRAPVADVMRQIRKYCDLGPKDPDPRLVLDAQHRLDKDPDGTDVIVHGYYAYCEAQIARTIRDRRDHGRTPAAWGAMDDMSPTLSSDQRDAVQTLLRTPGVTILTGGPGTGKTTVLAEALRIYRTAYPGGKISLCSPTGRAAQQLGETAGMPAQTIHSLLQIAPYQSGVMAADVDADLVVVDESSMSDIGLMHDLIMSIPVDAQIWVCGDADQLEPVGPGAYLYDCLAAGGDLIGIARLTTIHRQADGSAIIAAGRAVLDGRVPVDSRDCNVRTYDSAARVLAVVKAWVQRHYDADRPYDTQVLCVCNKRYDARGNYCPGGVDEVNEILQRVINPGGAGSPEIVYGKTVYRERDKVIITRNRTVKGNVVYSNGDLGIVDKIDGRQMTIRLKGGAVIDFGPDEMQDVRLAYAMTTHKAQGGTYARVLIVLTDEQVRLMPGLTRNLLYTAVTRASEWCGIVSSGDALNIAVAAPMHTRRTGLQKALWQVRAARGDAAADAVQTSFADADSGEIVDDDDGLGTALKALGWM